jgi:hypothetical protein
MIKKRKKNATKGKNGVIANMKMVTQQCTSVKKYEGGG